MLSRNEKKQISDDLKDFGFIDDDLENIIIKQDIEIKKEKEKAKDLLRGNLGSFVF